MADQLSPALHSADLPQELGRTYGGIECGKGVALRNQAVTDARNDAMREQPALPGEEDDITWFSLFDTALANKQDVARPDRRQHAGAGDAHIGKRGLSPLGTLA